MNRFKVFLAKFFVFIGLLIAWFVIFAMIQLGLEHNFGFRIGTLPQVLLMFAILIWPFKAFCRRYNARHVGDAIKEKENAKN